MYAPQTKKFTMAETLFVPIVMNSAPQCLTVKWNYQPGDPNTQMLSFLLCPFLNYVCKLGQALLSIRIAFKIEQKQYAKRHWKTLLALFCSATASFNLAWNFCIIACLKPMIFDGQFKWTNWTTMMSWSHWRNGLFSPILQSITFALAKW